VRAISELKEKTKAKSLGFSFVGAAGQVSNLFIKDLLVLQHILAQLDIK
jgi:hypothetical protein